MSENKELMLRALKCLELELPAAVYTDAKNIINTYVDELETELKELKHILQDAPEEWEFIPVLVPVNHKYDATYLDGRALDILDSAKIMGYVEENKTLKAELEQAKKDLEKYGHHKRNCQMNGVPICHKPIENPVCTCGFGELVDEEGDEE